MTRTRDSRSCGIAAALAALGLALAACGTDTAAPPREPVQAERPARAAEAVAALRTQLLAALTSGLERGPEAAIDACRVEAPRIAARVGSEDVRVGRTSHRVRNAANAPEAWMLPLLESFATAPPEPGAWRSVDLGERGIGYVEPIYLQPMCATCHGESVAPDLLARIRALYPNDAATGFRVGELRGLFWAVTARHAEP